MPYAERKRDWRASYTGIERDSERWEMKDIRNIERECEHMRMSDISRGRFLTEEEIRILLSDLPKRVDTLKTAAAR